ncbi:MAG: hypothetical protein AAF125_07275, partial [Chloroflexota bacterium]
MTELHDDQHLIEHMERLDFASESGPLADNVYKHIQPTEKITTLKPTTRFAVSAAILLGVIVLGGLISPSVRAFAQEIIAQVGNIRFTDSSGTSIVMEGVSLSVTEHTADPEDAETTSGT